MHDAIFAGYQRHCYYHRLLRRTLVLWNKRQQLTMDK
jgi:hypothetical protein